ncbi:hypothetical protein P154DRAFT_531061 [Amniculicola lignicola CBS 123094]|uniref:J domain-containing protein n=1 Tax=Amniculicola lignicola CBS 123094 TaxID=1392246 RepID=A0A6A5WUW2_9PLEO|nr:hypothetical protein P154DRAFT_531061 [Amniculicola lignicola CBS 123094]
MINFYDTLGVPRDGGHYQIKQAHRRIVLSNHSDKTVHLCEIEQKRREEITKAANNAWDTLQDPNKRAVYDHITFRSKLTSDNIQQDERQRTVNTNLTSTTHSRRLSAPILRRPSTEFLPQEQPIPKNLAMQKATGTSASRSLHTSRGYPGAQIVSGSTDTASSSTPKSRSGSTPNVQEMNETLRLRSCPHLGTAKYRASRACTRIKRTKPVELKAHS